MLTFKNELTREYHRECSIRNMLNRERDWFLLEFLGNIQIKNKKIWGLAIFLLPAAVNINGNKENPPNVERRRKYRACSRLSNANRLKREIVRLFFFVRN